MKEQHEPQARIYVCINEKAPGKAQCLKGEGDKCVSWLKEEVAKRSLSDRLWVTKTRCQGYCDPNGTAVVFGPTNRAYSDLRFEELPALFESFLKESKLT